MSSGEASGRRLSLSASLPDQFHKLVDLLIQGERECPLSLLDNVITSEAISLDGLDIVPAHHFDMCTPEVLLDLEQTMLTKEHPLTPGLWKGNTQGNQPTHQSAERCDYKRNSFKIRVGIGAGKPYGNASDDDDQQDNSDYDEAETASIQETDISRLQPIDIQEAPKLVQLDQLSIFIR